MSNMLSRLAGCVFALLAMTATYDVAVARAEEGDSGPKLVYTQCRLGSVNVCGEEPAHYECTRTWTLNLGLLTETLGIGISEMKCVEVGKVLLYKDYYGQPSPRGACGIVAPKVPADATSVNLRPDDDLSEEDPGVC